MKVLIACEFSGVVRNAFAALGHDAWSCDLLPGETAGQHYRGDVRKMLVEHWDLIIAHPECTYMTNSGVRWLTEKDDGDPEILKGAPRWMALWKACEFFRLFLDHRCQLIAIENPVPHRYAARWIGQTYSQIIQPFEYGHQETKKTCLWLKGLPPLKPTDILPPPHKPRVHFESPGPERTKNRSRTLSGIGKAMASQWGVL